MPATTEPAQQDNTSSNNLIDLAMECGVIAHDGCGLFVCTSDISGILNFGARAAGSKSAAKATTTPAHQATRPPTPIYLQAHNRLYRAIVSLPDGLCPPDEPLHERIVFFDCPRDNHPGRFLQELLTKVWNTSTFGWIDCGLIYNLQSGYQLTEEGMSDDLDARLLETGWGGEQRITYADPARTDFFVAPALRSQLLALQARVSQGGAA